jgi:hypothetical protein
MFMVSYFFDDMSSIIFVCTHTLFVFLFYIQTSHVTTH